MNKILEGKVAIVTGSGQGIGRDIALCFAENGAKVITNNRKPGSSLNAFEGTSLNFTEEEKKELLSVSGDAQTTATEIINKGGEAIPFFGDVSDYEVARKMIDTAIENYGRIDIIVHNASSNWKGNIMDMTEKLWDININSKLKAAFNLMHHAVPHMKEQGYGRFLNSSSDAFLGLEEYAAYGAANAGINAFSKATSKDLKNLGITVNSYTPLAKTRAWYNAAATYREQGIPKEIIEANAPAAMTKTAETMVPFLAYLASPLAENISGELFKLAANGEIGVWSESKVINEIVKEEGKWEIDELHERVQNMMTETKEIHEHVVNKMTETEGK